MCARSGASCGSLFLDIRFEALIKHMYAYYFLVLLTVSFGTDCGAPVCETTPPISTRHPSQRSDMRSPKPTNSLITEMRMMVRRSQPS